MARAMKDSGVAWIGSVPEAWTIGRIRQLYTERKEKVSDVDFQPLSVTMKGILPQLSTAAKTDAHDDRKLVRKGDFAINSRSDRRGSCGISPFDGSVSLINTILTPRNEMHPGFYNWLFHSTMFSDEFYKWGHGIVDDLWTTNWQDMKSILVPMPSLPEQSRIAAFLDRRCAEIDRVIAATQRTIEEYKKLKQSIITEAVTRGIRPGRKMKDSGVEWIGQIPEEWTVSRVGLHFDIVLGKMLCSEQPSADYTLEKYFCAANVHFDGISNTEVLKEMWFSSTEKKLYLVRNGDLLVVEGGAGAGGSAIVIGLTETVYIQNSIMIVRCRVGTDNRYLRYYLELLIKRGYIDVCCNKATIPHFTKDKLASVPYPVVPDEERIEIAEHLDIKCAEIDHLIESKQQLLTELESYKKSVIYEYVTGKKEAPVCL